jgi:TIR domain
MRRAVPAASWKSPTFHIRPYANGAACRRFRGSLDPYVKLLTLRCVNSASIWIIGFTCPFISDLEAKVADSAASKYRAFLSYSHHDMAWAKWLHERLEGFRIDKDLVGRETVLGPVPKMLRPIFRDREDFSGGHALTEATITAIDESAALIVLCSPISAGRPAVDAEVRLFRSRHPDRPVIPVIIDGTSPDNFPPALRFELAADGTVTDHPITILGPDLREAADGKNLGLAKTVAGLTGLGPDDVYRRAERERRRQGQRRAAVAAVIAVLSITGGAFFWQSHQQRLQLAEVGALVEKYSITSPAQAAVPGGKDSLTRAITAIAEGAATDPRYAKALELLKARKPGEAEPLLKAGCPGQGEARRQGCQGCSGGLSEPSLNRRGVRPQPSARILCRSGTARSLRHVGHVSERLVPGGRRSA